jgi:hypothetical protein
MFSRGELMVEFFFGFVASRKLRRQRPGWVGIPRRRKDEKRKRKREDLVRIFYKE